MHYRGKKNCIARFYGSTLSIADSEKAQPIKFLTLTTGRESAAMVVRVSRLTDRQASRQTDRQTDRQARRQADRQTGRQAGKTTASNVSDSDVCSINRHVQK